MSEGDPLRLVCAAAYYSPYCVCAECCSQCEEGTVEAYFFYSKFDVINPSMISKKIYCGSYDICTGQIFIFTILSMTRSKILGELGKLTDGKFAVYTSDQVSKFE